ncbi:unnamed protein product [Durusdinium trenchii]|uniref:Uncharacterized protein n=1 Tax=Durusdinium trenchii TaxID=1381693 RepID=A0ABP0KGH5_9DINO
MPPMHLAAPIEAERKDALDVASDEEDMPPLHTAAPAEAEGTDGLNVTLEEDMPPVHSAAARSQRAPLHQSPDMKASEVPTQSASEVPAVNRAFKVGDRVRICGSAKCKVSASQVGRVMPSDLTLGDRILVELEHGDRLSFKPEDLEHIVESKPKDDLDDLNSGCGSDSGDSLPPLEFISRDRLETCQIGPGDLVQLVNLQMQELNGQQGYVLRLTPGRTGQKEERVEVKMQSDGKMLSVKRSNVKLSCEEPPKRPKLRLEQLQRGDEVIVQGLTTALEYNGQRALVIESTDPRDRVTVELKQSGQRMSLRRDKLQVVHEGRSDSEGEGDGRDRRGDVEDFSEMPPLRSIRQPQSRKVKSRFRVGQKVFLDMKQKPEYHGQAVFVLPSDPLKVLDATMVTVQLPTGKRITTKEAHLREEVTR